MISKELFIETIEFIKKKRSDENTLITALEACSPQEYINAFIYSEYEEQTVKILREVLELPENDDTLEYWLYECDFGNDFKIGSIVDGEKKIDISTIEKLYNYLIQIAKNKKQDDDYKCYQEYLKRFYKWQAECEEQNEKEREEVQKD